MARVNVEDTIYRDERFIALCGRVGGMATAIGTLVLAWDMAQRFAKTPSGCIPEANWSKLKHNEAVLETGLAERVEGGVYVRGSGDHCDFIRGKYAKRREAGKAGGLKSQENRRSKTEQTEAKTTLSVSVSVSDSNSPSPSVSPSTKEKKNTKSSSGGETPPVPKVNSIETWAAYSEAYERRHGTKPVRNATVNAQLSALVKRLGSEEAPLVAAFYLTHNGAFYVRQLHPVGLLLKDAEKLRTEWVTGRRMTDNTARQVEQRSESQQVFDELSDKYKREEEQT